MARLFVAGILTSLVASLAGCGSTSPTVGTQATPRGSGATSQQVHQNLAAVAVAQDHAVVADGSFPSQFSIADLKSSEPTELRPLDAPVPMVLGSVTAVGDKIIVIGGRCDQGTADDEIERQCRPGTPLVYAFTPQNGRWGPIATGLDDAYLVGALIQPLADDSTATVDLFLRSPSSPRGEQRLFTLDAYAHTMTPQSLPDGFAQSAPGPDYQCFGRDGSETLMLLPTDEGDPSATPMQVWWRAAGGADWSDIAVPQPAGLAWQPDACIDGEVVVSAVGEAGAGTRERKIFDRQSGAWHSLPVDTASAADVFDGYVFGRGPARRWKDGQIWEFDPAKGWYSDTGVPARPVGYVRWSVPWGSDKIVALVDAQGQVFDKYAPMDLSLAIVNSPEGS